MKLSLLPALVVGSIYLTASLSHAQTTTTGSMAVTANVGQACTLTASAMGFGEIVVNETYSETSTINLNCSGPGTVGSVSIDDGVNAAASDSVRNMTSTGGDPLPYILSLTTNDTELTVDNLLTLVTDTDDSTSHSITIEGDIVAQDSLVDGMYTDTVTITAIYTF